MSQIIIREKFTRLDPTSYKELEGVGASVISDVCEISRPFDFGIKPMKKGLRLLGPALTVKLGDDSNLLLHKALALSRPGDVLVVDNGGDTSASVFGELMTTVAIDRKSTRLNSSH